MFIKKLNNYLRKSARKAKYRRTGNILYNEVKEAICIIFFDLINFTSREDATKVKAMIAIELLRDFLYKKENLWGTEEMQKAWLSVPRYKIFLLQKKLEISEKIAEEQCLFLQKKIKNLKQYINFSTNKEGRPQETSS